MAFRENRLDDARKYYESVVATGRASGGAFYNLGNVHYRLGNLGPALLFYEKGMELIPRDPDLRANLHFTRQKLKHGGATARMGLKETLFFPNSYLTLVEATRLALLLCALFFTTALLHLFFKKETLKWGTIVFSLLLFYFTLGLGIKYREEVLMTRGIVTGGRALLNQSFLVDGAGTSLAEG
ncbi:MAG: hypothetical protein Q7T11_02920, partial [Deltaproteobacteria bacterium]|nr:hypothetical protein [Deltaproteobacteria bacterium]